MPFTPTSKYKESLALQPIPDATATSAGVMSAADKNRLDGLVGTAPATSGTFTDYYVDAVNGNDANDGTSWATACQTVQGLLAKIPNDFSNGSAAAVHLAANGTLQQSYSIGRSISITGNGSYINPIQFRGPQMVPFVPATGPYTAALDAVPTTLIQMPDASGINRDAYMRLNFTTASPGWTVNDFAGRAFVRIKRAGALEYFECPIFANTADTISIDAIFSVLSTDAVEVVQPGVTLYSDDFAQGGGYSATMTFYTGSATYFGNGSVPSGLSTADQLKAGATFERIAFSSTATAYFYGSGVFLDRCIFPAYSEVNAETGGFVLCTGRGRVMVCVTGRSGGAAMWPRIDSATEPSSFVVENQVGLWNLTLSGSEARFGVGISQSQGNSPIQGGGPPVGTFYNRYGLSVWNAGGGSGAPCAIEVSGGGSSLYSVASIQGSIANNIPAILAREAAQIRVLPSRTFLASTGAADLLLETGAGVKYGTGVGQFMEVAGINGNYILPSGDCSRIYTVSRFTGPL